MMSSAPSQAESYECGSESQRSVGIKTIDKLAIKKGSSVLDLGCGTGSLAQVLSERTGPTGKVVAVDPDGERLKIAQEKYFAKNIEYIRADDKSFPSGQYNIIFSNATIHWISDKENLLKRVHENLCPGGQFVFTTPDGIPPQPEIGRKLFDKLLGPQFLHRMTSEVKVYLTADEYKRLASHHGFEVISFTIVDVHPKWRNLDHYIDSMYGWFGGEFDPSQFDRVLLQKLKEEYGDGPVIQTDPIRVIQAIYYKC